MKKKEEAKHLEKEWNEMNIYLKSFLETGDQEALHRFRVQIKKLRAMLTLFEDTSSQPGLLKEFKPVRKIFKSAGQIRDAHINLQLSELYELKNETFEASQKKIIEEGTNEFRQSGKKFTKNIRTAYKQLVKQLQGIENNSITDYYKKQLQQIAANLAVSGFTEDMHTNRKLIKILVYNHKFAEKALNGSLHFNTVYLDKLQESIGKWHDNIVAAQLFSSPELNDKPVVSKIKQKNASIKRSITLLKKDFLKKATTVGAAGNKN
jgi:CHAD domain-containing protein